jgi:hypothetical protein
MFIFVPSEPEVESVAMASMPDEEFSRASTSRLPSYPARRKKAKTTHQDRLTTIEKRAPNDRSPPYNTICIYAYYIYIRMYKPRPGSGCGGVRRNRPPYRSLTWRLPP